MKRCDAMQPIVLRGIEAVKAAEDAANRSLKNGRAMQMLRDASAKKPILRGKKN